MAMTPASGPELVLSPLNFLWGYSDSGECVCLVVMGDQKVIVLVFQFVGF